MAKVGEPIKQKDLRKCANCSKGVMHTGLPLFYRVTVQRYGVDLSAVQAQHGLELIMRSPALAQVLGPDRDIASPLSELTDVFICEECSTKDLMIAMLPELAPAGGEESEAPQT